MVLCMTLRFDNNEALVNWELIALDVKRGVDYLKTTQKISKVILFGHSGGGPTTTYYQAVAEKGPGYCQGPNKLTQCDSSGPNSVAGLTPADGIILADVIQEIRLTRSEPSTLRSGKHRTKRSSEWMPITRPSIP